MKRKAIFLDRDGTINPDPGYISNPDDFNLFDGVAESLAAIKKAGYLLILISNQSGIARKLITPEALDKIHEKLQKLLKPYDAEFDAIYFCPHHPDFPYEGITDCNCRKPKPGMILQAIKDWGIDPSLSYMAGDRDSDIKAGIKSSVEPVLISKSPSEKYPETRHFQNMQDFVKWLLSGTL